LAYNHGLRYPKTGLPALSSSSLRSPITDAKIGLEHDVPSTRPVDASWTIQTLSPEAEMSG
jgi:hypothetical protein